MDSTDVIVNKINFCFLVNRVLCYYSEANPSCLKYLKSLIVILFFLIPIHLSGQTGILRTQNIRGKVIDRETNLPVIGATIYLPENKSLIGTSSDGSGNFILKNIPVGRISLEISCVGYRNNRLDNIILTSAKELYLSIGLEKQTVQMDAITITSGLDKQMPINPMTTVSARSFSTEETYRYAGGLGDPARMAANFAGVMAESPQRNDIIIRGNSPYGLQYKLDGIEIPNPNHFGNIGTTGGPVTILNNNLLTNSDFLTGAFPAEYGNALAGVFDLKMRKGNPYRREFWGQIGWNGFEFGGEGSLKKDSEASYLAAYRYTFLELIGKLGIIGYTPQYQDLTIKMDWPTRNAGDFSFIALQGTSKIAILDSDKPPEDWTFTDEGEDIYFNTGLMMAGLNHKITIHDKIKMSNSLSLQGNLNTDRSDTFTLHYPAPYTEYGNRSTEIKLTASSSLQFKPWKFSNFLTGISTDLYHIQFRDSTWNKSGYHTNTDISEYLQLLRGFCQFQSHFLNQISWTAGIYSQLLLMNNTYSLEPRTGIRWVIDEKHAINAGYGLHSQMLPRPVYFFRTNYPDGSFSYTNKELGFNKSHHMVLGYDYSINPNLRLKTEVYYQYLFNIPVRKGSALPQYSLLNFGDSFSLWEIDSLVNEGKGSNRGIEFTLEKFFNNGYYGLFTLSLFDSKYTGADQVVRNSSFDGEFISNILGGYEWKFLSNHSINLDIKTMYAGGKRYVPIDIVKSMESGYKVYDWGSAYEEKYNNFFRLDVRLGYTLNLEEFSHRFSLDMQNITNHKNILLQRIDPLTGKIINDYQIGFFPMITYKIEFTL